MTTSDRGSITIWMLGLSLVLLLFGGLALDYWRALMVQRDLAATADSAAIAAASGIDEEAYRLTGEIILQPTRARSLAESSISWQDVDVLTTVVEVEPGSVSVTLTANVELGLLGVFVGDQSPLTVRASSTALPVLIP